MIKRCILWPLIRVWISGGITEHLFLDRNQYVNVINHLVLINAGQQLTIDCIGWSQTRRLLISYVLKWLLLRELSDQDPHCMQYGPPD